MEGLRERHRMLQERRRRSGGHGRTREGMCMTFCPEFEGLERTLQNDVSPYETDVMVKKYYKGPAGSREYPEDVRPVGVLWSVMDHLLRLFLNDQSIGAYEFVENRVRAVKKDMYTQGICGDAATEILERICRFYILSGYFLFEDPKFRASVNLSRIRTNVSALLDLYVSVGKNREEFHCYHLLTRMGDRDVLGIPYNKGGLRMKLAVEVVRRYQQNNFARFFALLRRLDFLSFCVAHNFIGAIRLTSMDMFKRSLVEKIDIRFFNSVLWTSDEEMSVVARRKGIGVECGKMNFKDKGGVDDRKVVLGRKQVSVNMSQPMKFIWCGSLDFEIFVLAVSEVVRRRIGRPRMQRAQGDVVDYAGHSSAAAPVEKTAVIETCVWILKDVLRRTTIERICSFLFVGEVRRYLERWRGMVSRGRKKETGVEERRLLVVLDGKIQSVAFKSRVKASVLGSLGPVFMCIGDVGTEDVVMYNLCVFSVSRRMHEDVHRQYYMANHMIDTPQNLGKRIDEIYERCMGAGKIRRSRLSDVVCGLDKGQATEVITRLIENGRNSRVLEDNLILLHKDKDLVECYVYYEEGDLPSWSL